MAVTRVPRHPSLQTFIFLLLFHRGDFFGRDIRAHGLAVLALETR